MINIEKDVFAYLLAGGKGERLYPLTKERAKPAVPFGGKFRIIDFTLSNCVNSGIRRIAVATQYKSASLRRHLALAWNFLNVRFNEYVVDVPPQQIFGERWYLGTADAVFQNLYFIEQEKPKLVLILSGDHIYKMDYKDMIETHLKNNADLTIATIVIEKERASAFGIMEVDETGRIINFKEKPKDPPTLKDDPSKCLASMGVYIFNPNTLVELLTHDAEVSTSSHDFGKDVIPYAIHHGYKVYSHQFRNKDGSLGYFQDVGTIDAYYCANMDILSPRPKIDIFDRSWPIYTHSRQYPPCKITEGELDGSLVESKVENSIIGEGSIISGAQIRNSIIFYDVKVKAGSIIEDSIIFGEVKIGRNVKIRRAIIDKHVEIPDGMEIGYNPEFDKKYFYVTPTNIVVLERGYKFTKKQLEGINYGKPEQT
ncbi:MAG: glucose-1-phosphate adenylyltransferase [Caldisericum sp.]|jgi:glucose-1-phosphate adenylyltransferase|nr:glucose-1-phosphate adenylyltransferase [Caldisericum sp.]